LEAFLGIKLKEKLKEKENRPVGRLLAHGSGLAQQGRPGAGRPGLAHGPDRRQAVTAQRRGAPCAAAAWSPRVAASRWRGGYRLDGRRGGAGEGR